MILRAISRPINERNFFMDFIKTRVINPYLGHNTTPYNGKQIFIHYTVQYSYGTTPFRRTTICIPQKNTNAITAAEAEAWSGESPRGWRAGGVKKSCHRIVRGFSVFTATFAFLGFLGFFILSSFCTMTVKCSSCVCPVTVSSALRRIL